MELEQLIAYFDTSPAVRLLRAQHAPFIVAFLHQLFKDGGRITVPMSELQAALIDYQESVHETYPEVLRDGPEQYLSDWCSGETRWLHRFLEANRNEPIYQLTPHTEDVFIFLDRALQKDLGFVGTESRLRLIISTLADLVAGASNDPEVHLRHLRDQRARIEAEIDRIELHGVVAQHEPATTREWFATAVTLLKQLMADFRAVEDRFKAITQEVQQQQTYGQTTRGSILQFALDAEDVLKKDDQGISFYEFVRFILSPVQQEKLQAIITELGRLDAIAQQAEGLTMLRRMVPSLLAEAEKVMRTNQRLTVSLRRLLDTRSASERQRLAQLLGEIKALAANLTDSPPPPELVGVQVDVGVPLSFPLSRAFWTPPLEFAPVDLTEHAVDDDRRREAFQMLAEMRHLDWRSMRSHIEEMIASRDTVTLREVAEACPLQVGVVELLGYLQIAKDDGHLIGLDGSEEIRLPAARPNGPTLTVTVPLVYFMHMGEAAHA